MEGVTSVCGWRLTSVVTGRMDQAMDWVAMEGLTSLASQGLEDWVAMEGLTSLVNVVVKDSG